MKQAPQTTAIIGAGVSGLYTARALHRRGVHVTVFDTVDVAGGASAGNAGWITPSLAYPLTSPSMLRQGIRSVARPRSAIKVPAPQSWQTISFLSQFARNSTKRRWQRGADALEHLNRRCLETYSALAEEIGFSLHSGSYIAGFASELEYTAFMESLEYSLPQGSPITISELDPDEVRAREPISDDLGYVAEVSGEAYIDPSAMCQALAARLEETGVTIIRRTRILDLRTHGRRVELLTEMGKRHSFDAAVVANGAWLGDWRRRLGIRTAIQGGRGYSFLVPTPMPITRAIYFPTERIVCTPVMGKLRISAVMDVEHPGARFNPKRIDTIVRTARRIMPGIDYSKREREWVGSRPCTGDGLPLIGESALANVYIHGGHAMWGMTQAPVSADHLAEHMMTGAADPAISPFDPLR